MSAGLRVVEADLEDRDHGRAIVDLVNLYARDSEGRLRELPDDARQRLVPGLRASGNARVFLAFVGERAVGVAVCFVGFSTFAAKPLVNVHDLVVHPEFRKRGVGLRLLDHLEASARDLGCCKLTLEVREDNAPARALYRSFGFGGTHGDGCERVFFLEKIL